MDSQTLTPHQLNAKMFIGAALSGNRSAIVESAISQHLRKEDFPDGYYPSVFEAIIQLLRDGKYVTPEAVYTVTAQKVPLEWLQEAYTTYGDAIAEMSDTANNIIQYAEARNAYKVADELKKELADNPLSARITAAKYGTQLMRPRSQSTLQSFPSDIRHRAMKNSEIIGRTVKTGIHWLDANIEGGLQTKYQLGIASRQKGRKTSFIRNVVLGVLRQMTNPGQTAIGSGIEYARAGADPTHWQVRDHVKIAFLAFENDQVRTYYDFAAMLAFEFLWKKGGVKLCHQKWGSKYFHEWCHSSVIMQNDLKGKIFTVKNPDGTIKQEGWPNALQAACQYAFWSMDRLSENGNLAIYDSEEKTGNLNTVEDLERILLEHTTLNCNPEDHFMFVTDYIGLVRKYGEFNKYKVQQEANFTIKRNVNNLLSGIGATALTIGQYNTDTKKSQIQGTKTEVMVESNPDMRRDVQTFMETSYDHDETAQKLTIKILDNSRGAMGERVQKSYWIHPESGYMIDYFDADRLFERTQQYGE